jgi:hypothetical protein
MASPDSTASPTRSGSSASAAEAAQAGAEATRPTTGTRTSAKTYAERAVLIPVGAALLAIETYSSPERARTQMRKFERRGNRARNHLEREVRQTQARLDRELRQRRRELEHRVGTRLREGTELADRVQERVLGRH